MHYVLDIQMLFYRYLPCFALTSVDTCVSCHFYNNKLREGGPLQINIKKTVTTTFRHKFTLTALYLKKKVTSYIEKHIYIIERIYRINFNSPT